jgi:hypothetical protein
MTPPTFSLAPHRTHRKRRTHSGAAPTPQELILETAAYEEGEENVILLTFDRAIDIAGLDGTQITVNDGVYVGSVFAATGAVTMPTPASVRIVMNPIGEAEVGSVTLSASATSGIAAVDDGGTWGGATNLELPFP